MLKKMFDFQDISRISRLVCQTTENVMIKIYIVSRYYNENKSNIKMKIQVQEICIT